MANQQIDILVVIDTERLKKEHPTLSQDPAKATGLSHDTQFMICTGADVVNGQATADLDFKATPGDEVSFTGVSISANSEDAVIVYGIKHWAQDNVFNQFVPDLVTRNKAVMPDSNTDNGLPALHTKINFSSFDSKVKQAGTEKFYVYIAVYTLAADGESQDLLGYGYWDPTITVS
jgi:hypothetical protein